MGENFFSVVFYSFYVLEGNYIELKKTIDLFMEAVDKKEFLDNKRYVELNLYSGRELARLIHNYSAAWLSLVDHTRAVNEKLKNHDSSKIRNFANEYEIRLAECLKDTFENVFLKDLLRYVQHKKIPVPVLHHKMRRIENSLSELERPLFEQFYSFEFNSSDIADFDWKKTNKEYIKNSKSVPIFCIIDRHFNLMKDFYLWIQFRDDQLHPYASKDVTKMTFEEWKQQKTEN